MNESAEIPSSIWSSIDFIAVCTFLLVYIVCRVA